MATSFFEKLTGASEEAEEKEEESPKTKKKKPAPSQKGKPAGKKRTIKKDYLDMPKTKKKQTTPETEPKEEEEVPAEAMEVKEKDWLEEAEGEEGQLTIDVYQTESDVVVKSTIAGVNPEDIDISITNDMVTIKGKRVKDEKVEAENYYYQELYWGAFSRSVILPIEVDADKVKASIKNGILSIKLPKSEKTKTKKIKVRTIE